MFNDIVLIYARAVKQRTAYTSKILFYIKMIKDLLSKDLRLRRGEYRAFTVVNYGSEHRIYAVVYLVFENTFN